MTDTGGNADDDKTDFAAFERAGWARRSPTYDSGFGELTAGVHRALLDAAMIGPGVRLLEVGCGPGRLATAACALGADVVASDAAESMVSAAGALGLLVVCAALPDLAFCEGAFDAVVGAFVVNHVADPQAAVSELARVTRNGGAIALSCWDTTERNRAQGIFLDALGALKAPRPISAPTGSPFAEYANAEGFAALLRRSGLRNVRVDEVTWTHRVDPERWWRDVLSGTVLTSALIEEQSSEMLRRIRGAYDEFAGQYLASENVVELPAAALVAVGVA
jgi:ubiquinone/menaquinone biosynthesis C-methylase UbiE